MYGNIITIGDAAGQCNPLGGEGIRHALTAGRMCAKVCDKYIEKGASDTDILFSYNKFWKSYIKRKWKTSYELAELAYNNMSDVNADRIVRFCKRMPKRAIVDVLFYYRFFGIGGMVGLAKRFGKAI